MIGELYHINRPDIIAVWEERMSVSRGLTLRKGRLSARVMPMKISNLEREDNSI